VKKGREYLDFSGNIDSTEFASTEWLSDLEVVSDFDPFMRLCEI
jgi:hypothetical protein